MESAENSIGCPVLNGTSDKRSSCQKIYATKLNELHIRGSKNTFLCLCLLLMLGHSWTLEDVGPNEPAVAGSYEEFKFDHEVSQQEADEALRKLNATHAGTRNSCNSMDCSKVLNYCWTEQFEKDHCWCEMQHREEGLPYKPHKCFVEEKIYKPSVGSCFFFEEVKECCCVSAFLKEWRRISAAPFSTAQPSLLGCALALLCLLNWRSRGR